MSKLATILALVCMLVAVESKLLRSSRYFDDSSFGPGYGMDSGLYGGATGERAVITVRGARNPYDGSAPAKIAIEDQPYHRGPYPRGVYDRLDAGYGRGPRMPMYPRPMSDYGYSGYNGYNGYNQGYGSMYGAPSRIAVTGAYPYGYGSRFA